MKRSVMLLISASLFVSMLVLGVASKLQAQDHQQCSLATFQGTYGILGTGFFQGNPPNVSTASLPFARLGILTADGAGNLSVVSTISNNGAIGPQTVAGTYMVNPDCTGSFGVTNFVIADNAKKILVIDGNPGRVRTAIATRIDDDVLPCSVDTLQGSFGIEATGFFQFGATIASQPFAQIGTIGFDGAGNAVGQFTFSDNGNIGSQSIVATYSVSPDCTGTFTATSPGDGTGSFVIVGNGKEFLFLQTVTGTVVTATGIKQ